MKGLVEKLKDMPFLTRSLHCPQFYWIRAHSEQLSEFERGIIGLKEGGWANQRIARHMGRSDAAIRRRTQEFVGSGRF
ncbi:hypothetical protein TNCV_1811351 [Trichonephila clavipes]|nr:hypothetical protein TNCV_1811351 [Trichonephila clavipes]